MPIFRKGRVRLVASVFKNKKVRVSESEQHSGPVSREVNEMNLHRKDEIRYRMLKLNQTINII